jgi:beta-glucanase (GH16 family)
VAAAMTPARPQLLWEDEFSGTAGTPPDPTHWIITTGGHWGANEIACYTSSPANVGLDGAGHLLLTARAGASCDGRSYSAGRVETRGKYTWRYGYLEVRAQLPISAGALPAIWMLGPDAVDNWPRSGETDIVEAISSEPTTVHTNVHGIDAAGNHWESGWWGPNKSYAYTGSSLADGYHVYALDWEPGMMRFFFDGQVVRTLTTADVPVWLWGNPFYLLLNVAVGQNDNSPAPTPGAFPAAMSVDYVRLYASRP